MFEKLSKIELQEERNKKVKHTKNGANILNP